jgi:hypothetical protein
MMPPGGVWRIDRRLFTGVRGRGILRGFIVVGYDGAWIVRDEELSLWDRRI